MASDKHGVDQLVWENVSGDLNCLEEPLVIYLGGTSETWRLFGKSLFVNMGMHQEDNNRVSSWLPFVE